MIIMLKKMHQELQRMDDHLDKVQAKKINLFEVNSHLWEQVEEFESFVQKQASKMNLDVPYVQFQS